MALTTRPLNCLTPQQGEQYHSLGYVKGFRVFSEGEVATLQEEYEKAGVTG